MVNVGGLCGRDGVPNRAAIATAKAGIAGLTGSLAIELASKNVTVNCVSPRYIQNAGVVPAHIQRRTAPLGEVSGSPVHAVGPILIAR